MKRYTPSPESMVNLRKAFHALRKAGYTARMNFSCCGSCGWYELSQIAVDKDKIVFYHRQAGDRLERTGICDLQWSGDVHEICFVLEACGVHVSRKPEDENKTIEIDLSRESRLAEQARENARKFEEQIAWDKNASLNW